MKPSDIENLEIELLLEAIHRRYGYDFRSYARASIRRRVLQFMNGRKSSSISEMIPSVLYDESFFEQMVKEFSITVTQMFRDPETFVALRNEVVPILRSYPFIKVWHAGCATGEEAYSLAIVMLEEGLTERTTFFATDFNDTALAAAKDGVYELDNAKQFTENYQLAGGKRSFSDYYHAKYEAITIGTELKQKITFANHNLVTDQVFTETHLILCRNVFIYFNKQLQERVLHLFLSSLVPGGFLCLGKKEHMLFSKYQKDFKEIDSKNKIYQKRTR